MIFDKEQIVSHKFGPRTRLIHGDNQVSHRESGSHAFPIIQTSTFVFDSVEEGEATFAGRALNDVYSRISNPNLRQLEHHLCILEEGEAAQVFDTGMSAIRVALECFLEAGDHIIAHRNLYGGTHGLLKKMKRKCNIEATFVDARNPMNVAGAIREKTRVVLLESPSNPTLDILNFEEIAQLVHHISPSIGVILDNTFATPVNQKPLNHGVDMVVHSLTKYFNPAGRFLGGAIITSQELMHRVWETHDGSGMMTPLVAAFILDSMEGLQAHVKMHNHNAMQVVYYLAQISLVKEIYYPGMFSHPNHDVAKKLMSGFGGMVSFELSDDARGSKTRAFLNQLSRNQKMGKGIIPQAVSLGSVDTLICCPARTTHLKVPREERLAQGITDNLIRLSVGTEDAGDIVYSLERGFQAIS